MHLSLTFCMISSMLYGYEYTLTSEKNGSAFFCIRICHPPPSTCEFVPSQNQRFASRKYLNLSEIIAALVNKIETQPTEYSSHNLTMILSWDNGLIISLSIDCKSLVVLHDTLLRLNLTNRDNI